MDIVSSLLVFLKIAGISAASGLHCQAGQELYVIADNSPYLYHYGIASQTLHKILLDSTQTQEGVDKANKDDLEAIYPVGDALLTVGSGSTANRRKAFIYYKSDNYVRRLSLDSLYDALAQKGGLNQANFNIEGIAYREGIWYFLNRGNGPDRNNMVFTFKGDSTLGFDKNSIEVHPVELPSIDSCPTGFSDGVLSGNRLWFIATAEDKASNFEDGANKGSFLSYLDLESLQLGPIRQLSDHEKLEGITLYTDSIGRGNKGTKNTDFLFCEDPDDVTNSICPIYRLADVVDQ